MANGILPAAALVPATYGLLSVADVTVTTDADYQWQQGFAAQFNSRPQLIRLLNRHTGIVPDGTVYDAGDHPMPQFEDIEPFYIELVYKGSSFGLSWEDKVEQIKDQLRAASGKAVEFELWTGASAIDNQPDTSKVQSFLTLSGDKAATVLGSGGVSPKKALSLIEGAIANSPTGGGGVIHVTRDLGSILTLQGAIKDVDGHLETVLGTKVAIGSGYIGNGPGTDQDTATDSSKWMFATGPVSVWMGEPEVVQEDAARAFKSSTNDVNITALRPAGIYFDPSIFYGVQIAIPDAP